MLIVLRLQQFPYCGFTVCVWRCTKALPLQIRIWRRACSPVLHLISNLCYITDFRENLAKHMPVFMGGQKQPQTQPWDPCVSVQKACAVVTVPHLGAGDTKASVQSCLAACVSLGVIYVLCVPFEQHSGSQPRAVLVLGRKGKPEQTISTSASPQCPKTHGKYLSAALNSLMRDFSHFSEIPKL